ncbi:hypothetical protein [Nostoc sp.]
MRCSQLDRVITQFFILSTGFVVFGEMLKDEKFVRSPLVGAKFK